MEPFVIPGVLEDSDMDEEELAALAMLLDVSTTDLERSRFCFCRNLGNFEPCGVDGGDDGDGECLEVLLLLDIVVEGEVVAVVIVVAGEREADLDALELALLLSDTLHVQGFLPFSPPTILRISQQIALKCRQNASLVPLLLRALSFSLKDAHLKHSYLYPQRTTFTSSSRPTTFYIRSDNLAEARRMLCLMIAWGSWLYRCTMSAPSTRMPRTHQPKATLNWAHLTRVTHRRDSQNVAYYKRVA